MQKKLTPTEKLKAELRRTKRQLAKTKATLFRVLSTPIRPEQLNLTGTGLKLVPEDPIRDFMSYGM